MPAGSERCGDIARRGGSQVNVVSVRPPPRPLQPADQGPQKPKPPLQATATALTHLESHRASILQMPVSTTETRGLPSGHRAACTPRKCSYGDCTLVNLPKLFSKAVNGRDPGHERSIVTLWPSPRLTSAVRRDESLGRIRMAFSSPLPSSVTTEPIVAANSSGVSVFSVMRSRIDWMAVIMVASSPGLGAQQAPMSSNSARETHWGVSMARE